MPNPLRQADPPADLLAPPVLPASLPTMSYLHQVSHTAPGTSEQLYMPLLVYDHMTCHLNTDQVRGIAVHILYHFKLVLGR